MLDNRDSCLITKFYRQCTDFCISLYVRKEYLIAVYTDVFQIYEEKSRAALDLSSIRLFVREIRRDVFERYTA